MVRFFLNHAEDPGGRLAPLLAARHRRPEDPAIGVIDGDPLIPERNDRHDRLAGRTRLDELDRALAPALRGAHMTASRDQHGQTHNGNMCKPQPGLMTL